MKTIDIYGTMGPACYQVNLLKAMFDVGMTGMRINLSHKDLDPCEEWITCFHQAGQMAHIQPKLLIDMQGPELRVGHLEQELVLLEEDTIDCSLFALPSIITSYLKKGQEILLDDGKLCIEMIDEQHAKVIRGGILRSNKSISLKNCTVDTPTLTPNDLKNLSIAKNYGVTGIMQPFVRNAKDLITLRSMMNQYGLQDCQIFAKIENLDGIHQLESLMPYCDEIIIARGDLGNAVGLTHLPSVQKYIESICKAHHKPYMVVTEMLHSMQHVAVPTRAEVSDIYHAIYHGAHSIMLTGETAVGNYPLEAMTYFVQTAKCALEDLEKGDL